MLRERQAWDETNCANERKIADLEDYVSECKETLAQQGLKVELARLQPVETLREKFDRERDVHLKRIRELEERLAEGASRKDSTPSSVEPVMEKGDTPALLDGELMHGVRGRGSKASLSESVSATEGGHCRETSEGLGGAGMSDVVKGTDTAETAATKSPETDPTSKGVSASDKATPNCEESEKDKFIGPSGEGSDKAELMFPPNQPLVVVQMLQMLQMLQVVQMIVF